MQEYATVSVNVDSRGLCRILIKKNIADAMGLPKLAEKRQRLMAAYDTKKGILQIMPLSEFEKRMKL